MQTIQILEGAISEEDPAFPERGQRHARRVRRRCYVCGRDALYVVELRVSTTPMQGTAKQRGHYVRSVTRQLCPDHMHEYVRLLEFGRKPPPTLQEDVA